VLQKKEEGDYDTGREYSCNGVAEKKGGIMTQAGSTAAMMLQKKRGITTQAGSTAAMVLQKMGGNHGTRREYSHIGVAEEGGES
jgi:hypothetical protein